MGRKNAAKDKPKKEVGGSITSLNDRIIIEASGLSDAENVVRMTESVRGRTRGSQGHESKLVISA